MRLILLGPPGAGKGTQGALMAERSGVPRIVTGDLLRQAVREGTPLGRKARAYMEEGELVPDDLILALIREVLTTKRDDSATRGEGFILDGFPRTMPQAEELDQLLDELRLPIDTVVVLDVPEDVLVRRLSGRRTCPRCGAVYNVHYQPPRSEGICDVCGAELVQREDDSAETVRRRIAVYQEQTAPLIDYYERGPTPVLRVTGVRAPEEVAREIDRALAT